MKRYHLVNNIIGWLVGIAACTVFIMTAEATASWWDCGEYIATAFKLQVGHPPGAPTFQLFGRLFSMFSTPETAAYAVNVFSAVVSGLGIMFLFWTITLLGKLIMRNPNPSLKDPRTWALFASGIVGAMAYCFSDTYWFSAVEGEVYATSSFFTAVTFWAVLKWEEQAEDPRSLRWLVFISFLVGIAIGVHLLNLLVIPAIAYVVYFKKWKNTNAKGFLGTGLLSLVVLAVVLWGVIPWVVNLSSAFDVTFVNKLGMHFNSGTIFFFLLMAAAIGFGLWFTSAKKKNKPIWNAAILSFLMLVVGYSTFFILVIRANTNTPLNENAPKDAVAMRAYLGREQYGETPLLTGPYYTAGNPIDAKEGYVKYVRGQENGKDRYIAKSHSMKYIYRKDHTGVFPRMYSPDTDRKHPLFYKYWAGEPPTGQKPTMSQNLKFFNQYQLGWMYWRYFMWNFAGRQNDIQGHHFNDDGSIDYMHGNWISGIKFIDQMRLGPQDNQTDAQMANKARNTYFLLPLILGIIGLVYHCKEDKRGAFVNFIMFFMTGLAIAIYLNMPPCQPRERDYAFVGSFYFFAVWIGLGVMAICDWIGKLLKKDAMKHVVTAVVFAICFLAVPVRMCSENWDDHDRSQKTAARDFAKNYLGNLDKNSILVTFGDNDTFPIWYAQEVEEYRTDVRILNFTLAGMHWYIEQLYNKLYESEPLPLTLPFEGFYDLGKEVTYLDESNNEFYELEDLLKIVRENPSRFSRMTQTGESVLVLPSNKFKISVDVEKLRSMGVYKDADSAAIPAEVRFVCEKQMLYRHELMFLDLLATNHFERSIYVMNPGYFRRIYTIIEGASVMDGMVYKLVPYPNQKQCTKATYDYFLNGAKNDDGSYTPLLWGNLNKDIYVDPISLNMGSAQRQSFMIFARSLSEGQNLDIPTATKFLEMVDTFFPKENFARDKYCLYFIETYYKVLGKEKATELWNDIFEYYSQDIAYAAQYLASSKKEHRYGVMDQVREDVQILWTLSDHARKILGDEKLAKEAESVFQPYEYVLMQQQAPQAQQGPQSLL